MNTEQRIREHLAATTGALQTPNRLEEVMREGRLRRIRRRGAIVVGVAAVLAAVVALAGNLPSGGGTSPVATSPDNAPTTTPTTVVGPPVSPAVEPAGVLVADSTGIAALDRTGDPAVTLPGGPLDRVSTVYSDQMGGIVYQHESTPPPWQQGTLLWLASGESTPEPIATPFPGRALVPVGPAVNGAGSPLFVYLLERPAEEGTEVAVVGVDLASEMTEELTVVGASEEVWAGGSVLAILDRGDVMCPTLRLVDVEGAEIGTPIEGCLPVGAGVGISADGNRLALLAEGTLSEVDVVSGETRREIDVPDAYMVTSGANGWAVRTPAEVRLIGPDWDASLPPVEDGWVIPYGALSIAPGATLASGSDERPCTPTDLTLPAQELPDAVADMRRTLFDLATSCDYEGLAALVAEDGTTISFGAPDDPVAFWVGEGRRGTEPLVLLAELLTLKPGKHTDGWYAWPAVHVDTEDEANWQELEEAGLTEGILDAPDGRAYYGYRVGIASDGTWMFFVAGD